jgi:hypothetical protein
VTTTHDLRRVGAPMMSHMAGDDDAKMWLNRMAGAAP